ncbi:MAG: hypothetical protein NWQ85_04140 [Schleiferiaceae bacterium]|nr:hypothetical protein [Schleiferiaceae bacterium]
MTRIGSWLSLIFWVLILQLLVLSQIEVSGYLSPYLYPLVIVLAPANFDRYGLLIIAALMGLAMDFHEGSGGLHLMATSLLAYTRPWMLNAVIPRAAEEQLPFAPQDLGLGKWFTLLLLTFGLHHVWLFLWASHDGHVWSLVLLRSLINIVVSGSLATAIGWFYPKSSQG